MRRILVTGGAGYLGSELVRRAPAAGWEVRATFHTRRPELDAEWVHVDVRDAAAVARAVDGVDCVVHTAFVQHGADAWSTTAEGAGVVARAAAGTRLIHLSSDVIFDGTRGRYREADEPRPVHDYGRAKVEAERLVAAAHPGALIARTSLLYGGPEPGPQERLAAAGGTFFVDEIRSPVQVGDLADALLELAELDTAGILHLGGADDVSRYELALLLRGVGSTEPRESGGAGFAGAGAGGSADPARIEPGRTTPDRCPNVSLDSSRAAALLESRLRGVREVLA